MSKVEKTKKRIFEIIQIGNRFDFLSSAFDVIIATLIILNILVTFLQTFDELAFIHGALGTIEYVTIIIFIAEYALRIWTSDYLYPREKKGIAALKFIVSFFGVIDLLTIVSFFIPFMFTNGFTALRILRVVRIMRLFKLNSSYDAINVIIDVLKEKKDQIISSVFMIVILMFASSLCMYSLEHEAQPDNFKNAFSGIWWSVSTLLTVGYGDIYPVTIMGKIMAIVISFLGVGMVAIPTGIISAGFVEYYTKIKTGTYIRQDSDFVVIDIDAAHEFCGKELADIQLHDGLYTAVIIRDDDILTPYPGLVVKSGDSMLLGSTGNKHINARLEEVKLEKNHPWIGDKIKELDISRQTFVIMVRRKNKVIKPEATTVLREGDVVVLLDKRID